MHALYFDTDAFCDSHTSPIHPPHLPYPISYGSIVGLADIKANRIRIIQSVPNTNKKKKNNKQFIDKLVG